MRKITGIIVHCTATRPEWWSGKRTSEKVAEIKRWHVEGNGWADIGYHYLIDRDGTVANGRPVSRTGAHVAGHNTGTIGISLFGGHGSAETDAFVDNFTLAQDTALRLLLNQLREKYGDVSVTGHNEYAAKACPGFNVRQWMAFGAGRPRTATPEAPKADYAPDPSEQPQPNRLAALLAAIIGAFRR